MRMDQVKFKEKWEPRQIYLRHNATKHCSAVNGCCGKTARSWVTGCYWSVSLFQFKEYTEITEQDHNEWLWMRQHRYRIGRYVDACPDPQVFRQIAQLVGYKEETQTKGATR